MGKSVRRNTKKRSTKANHKQQTKAKDVQSNSDQKREEDPKAAKALVPKRLAPLDHIKNLYDGANANPGDRERKICHKKDLMEVVRQIHQSEKHNKGIVKPVVTPAKKGNSATNQRSGTSGSTDSGGKGLPSIPLHSSSVALDSEPTIKSARSILQENLHENARRYNELKRLAEERTAMLDFMIDELMEVEIENESLRKIEAHQTADTKRIDELRKQISTLKRSLRERRRKRDQYDHMKRRLCTNQVAFDAHIKGMEDALQASTREFDEVKLLMHQLEVGNTTAQEELKVTIEQISKEEELRSKQMAVRRQEAANAKRMEEWRKERERQRLEMEARLRGDLDQEGEKQLLDTLSATEGKEEKLAKLHIRATQKVNTYEEAFAQIREATGVRTLDEMVEKYLGQGANRAALLDERAEADARQKQVREQLMSVKKEFAELKAAGIGGSELNREMYDKLDDEILRFRHELKVQQSVSSRLDNVLIKIQAGMNGLQQRLTPFDHILEQNGEVLLPKTGIEALDSILLCEMKLCKLLGHINQTLVSSGGVAWQDVKQRQVIPEVDTISVAGSVKDDTTSVSGQHHHSVESGSTNAPVSGALGVSQQTAMTLQDIIGKAAITPFAVGAPRLHENNIRVKPKPKVVGLRRFIPSGESKPDPISESEESDIESDSEEDESEADHSDVGQEYDLSKRDINEGETSALKKKLSGKLEVHDAATLKKIAQARYRKAVEKGKQNSKRQKSLESMKKKRKSVQGGSRRFSKESSTKSNSAFITQ